MPSFFSSRSTDGDMPIFLILCGLVVVIEILGHLVIGQSFLFNLDRLPVIILQVSVIGIIAVGVTQVIIMGGIDLSGGSVAAFAAMVAATAAQVSSGTAVYFPGLTDMPVIVPILVGLAVGALAGVFNGAITAYTGVPPFIPTLGMLVVARGLAVLWGEGASVTGLSPSFNFLGNGVVPVFIFLPTALLFHVLLSRTLYGRRTYAIGSNEEGARAAGINVNAHKVLVYVIAGALSGLAGVVVAAQATMAHPNMGVAYELDAISAAVIGGASLFGGRGRISGTLIGVLILGVITSGFTMLRINADYQTVVKGLIILAVVYLDQRRHGFASARAN